MFSVNHTEIQRTYTKYPQQILDDDIFISSLSIPMVAIFRYNVCCISEVLGLFCHPKLRMILVARRPKRVKSADVTGRDIIPEGLFMIPLGISFRYHCSYNEDDHSFEVLKTSSDYNCLIPAWYSKNIKPVASQL